MKTDKHIALISVHGDPAVDIGKEEAGGQNVYVREVGEALAKQGWQVDMFTRKSNTTQPAIVEHSPRCRTIRLVAGPEAFVPRDEIFNYLPDFVKQLQRFEADQRIRYSLVHTNYWLSAWVGMQLNKEQPIRQIHTYHSLGAVKYRSVEDIPPIANTRLETEKACLETAERIVATSPQEKDHMREMVSEKGNISIIPCGTDIRRYGQLSRAQGRARIGIPNDSLMVFYVGRFDRRKGIETLVRAVSHSQLLGKTDLRLVIAGGSRKGQSDGIERERIEGIVDELGLRQYTTFTGQVSHEDLPYYFAAANVSVVPSHYEPFGLVAIEAMASYTPVVASDVGGLKYTVVSEETGILCPPKDDKAFGVAIDRILSSPDWESQLAKNARDRVEKMFSWSGVARQLSDLYNEVAEGSASKTELLSSY